MWIRRINYGSCLKRGSDPVEHTVYGTNKINFIIKIVIQEQFSRQPLLDQLRLSLGLYITYH